MDKETKERQFNKKVINLTWAGVGFSALYWFFESVRDVILLEKASLFERLVFPDAMSFWMRLLVVSIIILFGIHAESYRKRYEYYQDKKIQPVYPTKIFMISFSYSALYWVLESVRDTFVFEKGDILHSVFSPGPMALWMRLLTVFIIILFSLYYQTLINERRKMIEQFRKEQDYLEKKIAERTSKLKKTLNCLKNEMKEKDEIREQLFHAQKMEAIGLLAGGIAHDFGNLLQGIRGVAEAAMMDIDETNSQHNDYKQILDLAKTASRVVHKIVHFSRKQPMKFYSMNINTIIEDSANMVNRWIGKEVVLETDLDPDLWLTSVNYTALEQVILNMAINAKDAMPNGGTFIIKTKNKEMDEIEYSNDADDRLCKCVCLSFSDTGTGMDSETLNHIFEPYYTTKDSGKGTGMGLSVVYGIVKQHDGWIKVESEVDQGTTFKIFFPSQGKKVEDEIPEPTIVNESYENNGGILIEDTKRKLAEQLMNA
ncbi:hypothetical protein JW824_03395 [bacterium]|nr:hypothetical protein [bacterium]RQV97821.1 MAG: hypothetical protein EH221_03425 [bacterium]